MFHLFTRWNDRPVAILLKPFWLRSHIGPSEHCGSVRPRVSQVSFFDLLIQVSATQLSLFLCISSVFMANDRTFQDAVHTSLPGSPIQILATTNISVHNTPIRIHCKTGPLSGRLVFETRAFCQDSVARFKDDSLPCAVESPFCRKSAPMLVRQPSPPERRPRNRKAVKTGMGSSGSKITIIFPRRMPEAIWLFQPLMYEHKSSAFMIADLEWENQCSRLHHPDTTKCSVSLLLICVSLVFLMLCCCKLLGKQALRLRFARPLCEGRPFASSPFRRIASRGLLFICGVPFLWWMQVAIYVCRPTRPSPLLHGNRRNAVQSSIRHIVLLLPDRHLALQMSIHVDTSTTIQRHQHVLLQSLSILASDMFAHGAFVPRVSAGRIQPVRSLSQKDASREALLSALHNYVGDGMLFNRQKCFGTT